MLLYIKLTKNNIIYLCNQGHNLNVQLLKKSILFEIYMPIIKTVSLDVFGTLISPKIPVGICYSQFASKVCGVDLPEKLVEKHFFNVYKEMCIKYPNFGNNSNMSSRTWWNKVVSKYILK